MNKPEWRWCRLGNDWAPLVLHDPSAQYVDEIGPRAIPPDETLQQDAKLDYVITEIRSLIENSDGVTGLHHNGDVALWHELLAGGRHEAWLECLDTDRLTDALERSYKQAAAIALRKVAEEYEGKASPAHFLVMHDLLKRAKEYEDGH